MKKRILATVVLSLLLLVLGLDIIFASIDPGRRRLPVLMYTTSTRRAAPTR